MSAELLHVNGISLSFGGLKAVSNFHLKLAKGDLQGLIGPNGAGKTTIFNLLTGVYRPDGGSIHLHGKALQGLRPYQIALAGIARTFQNIRLLGELNVLDNVRMAFHLRTRQSMLSSFLRSPRSHHEEMEIAQNALLLLERFGLAQRREEEAKNLSYGDQRRLEIARALATKPEVLLLDEPAAGMNRQEKHGLCDLIARVQKDYHVTILLIEHDMGVVMDLCQKITVLDYGETIACGSPSQIQNDPKVIEAYLGEPE